MADISMRQIRLYNSSFRLSSLDRHKLYYVRVPNFPRRIPVFDDRLSHSSKVSMMRPETKDIYLRGFSSKSFRDTLNMFKLSFRLCGWRR
jgi:hypothetical protein